MTVGGRSLEPELSFAPGALLHFPENKTTFFCWPGLRREAACRPPADSPPASPQLSKLPKVTGATSRDGFRGARELLTARGCGRADQREALP